MKDTFANKVCVVTGAASGIGRALVEELAAQNAQIVALDINEEALKNLQMHLAKTGADIDIYAFDIVKKDVLKNIFAQLEEKYRRLDMWFNIAGINGSAGFLEQSFENFERVIEVNLMALVHSTQLALRHMEKTGVGTIVNMGSVAGLVPAPLMTAYTAAKHAVVGFTRSLQAELELLDSSIDVILINPGFAETQIVAKGERLGFPEWLAWMLAKPETIAKDICQAVKVKKPEVTSTLNGKLMVAGFRYMPQATVKSSRMLLTKSFKDLILRKYHL